jgi:hypothetical protein
MKALEKSADSARLFISGKYWKGGDDTQKLANDVGFAVIYENGDDLTVAPSGLKRW